MRLTPALIVVGSSAAAADTLLVGPSGSGAPYEEITAAVGAAQAGDTVLVLEGEYDEFATIDIDKPLTLLGAGSGATRFKSLPTFPGTTVLPLYVHDLAAALLAERLATLAAAPSVTRPGATVTVEASGEPSSAFLTFFALGQGPALAIPGVAAVIVLDLGGYAPLPVLALDGAGLGALAVGVPAVSALAGTTVPVQGLAQSPSGLLSVSSPAFVGIAP